MTFRAALDFNKDKYKNMTHYIISKCGDKPNVGKTVLFKLSYFSDFNHYEIFEKKMTGEPYRKIPNGPAPIHFDDIVKELETEKNIETKPGKYGGYDQKRFHALTEPDMSIFTEEEVGVIDSVIDEYCELTATKISALSHQDMPYKATNESDIIDYELVFYRSPEMSVRDHSDD